MSVYRDKKEWNKWNEMVLASEHAKEDFNDFADDIAIIRADKKIQSLLSKNYVLERQLKERNQAHLELHADYNTKHSECEGLKVQLAEAREGVKRLSKIAPIVKDKDKNYRSWFFAGRFMNGGELGNILLKSGWSDDDCRKLYYENNADWDN